MLRIFAILLITYYFYTHHISLIFAMWDYFYVICLPATWYRVERLIRALKEDR